MPEELLLVFHIRITCHWLFTVADTKLSSQIKSMFAFKFYGNTSITDDCNASCISQNERQDKLMPMTRSVSV